MIAGILFGLAPALKSWKVDLETELKEGGRGSTSSHQRAQSSLVVVQMALTLMLLVSAGLLFRTIRNLWEVDPGFDTRHLITLKTGFSHSATRTAAGTRVAYQQLIERIRKIPGVQAADYTGSVPLSGQGGTMPFWIGAEKPASLQGAPRVVMFLTGPDYLRTMGIPLLRGRFFTPEDTTKSPCVMVVDSGLARTYFPDSDPLRQTMSAGFSPIGPCRIVGVVGHIRHWGLEDAGTFTQSQAYFPLYQDPDQWVPTNYPNTTIVVRTPIDIATVIPAMGSEQPVYAVRSMRQIVAASMAAQRFPMILLESFAGLALLLASVGIYGVISYSMTRRVREIGIRMALGAEKGDILRMVLGQGLRLALGGIAIGMVAALALTRVLKSFSSLLYGVRVWDPLTLIAVSLVLMGAALLACYIPARRAARLDQMMVLRHE